MAGIEDIVQGLEIELNKKLNTQQELTKRQSEIAIDIDILKVMIAAGLERTHGYIDHTVCPLKTNPFPVGIIRWHCFEVLKGATEPMHVKLIHQKVFETRQCSLAAVSHELYGKSSVFQRGEPGFFTLADV
jgi:hypothetical protein